MKQKILASFGIAFFFATIASTLGLLAYQHGLDLAFVILPYVIAIAVSGPFAVWLTK